MSQQIKIFEKARSDLSNDNCLITVTDPIATNTGQDFINYIRNRNNFSAWLTTDSTDAAGTTIEVDLLDEWELGEILLIKHNFKSFTIKYYDGGWTDFSTPISETANTEVTNHYSVTPVTFSRLQIVINGCHIVDADKVLHQLIVTSKLGTGQFDGWPVMKAPKLVTNRRKSTMLSGKINIAEGIESFAVELTVQNWKSDADLSIVEDIYFKRSGVLVWPCGGDSAQFSSIRLGYRVEDIYLMRPTNEWSPEWVDGIYTSGMKVKIQLAESVN